MKFKDVDFSSLKSHLLAGKGFVDVRAPIEFVDGSLPGAVNIPIMSDEERARVGTCYKHSGRESAIQLGHKIVSGDNRDFKLCQWRKHFEQHPESLVYCARGGLRSKISADWIADLKVPGVELCRLVGGFKEARQSIINHLNEFAESRALVIMTGMTGSAKTHALQALVKKKPTVDLEAIAHHRGSAFGAWEIPQPKQINFENSLYLELIKVEDQFSKEEPLLLEDESRTVGLCVIPEKLFQKMRSSPVVLIEESLETRIENIFKDYILGSAIGSEEHEAAIQVFERYEKSLLSIQRKLGGVRTQEILRDLEIAKLDFVARRGLELNRVWIGKLLRYYYDPMYLGSLKKRDPQILFRGRRTDVEAYLLL